jgi:hypothetical protein
MAQSAIKNFPNLTSDDLYCHYHLLSFLDADGPTTIRAGGFGFVTFAGNTWERFNSVRTGMFGGYPVTPPEAAFLALVPKGQGPLASEWHWQDRHRLRSAINVQYRFNELTNTATNFLALGIDSQFP